VCVTDKERKENILKKQQRKKILPAASIADMQAGRMDADRQRRLL
jgi:hypothetical protein